MNLKSLQQQLLPQIETHLQAFLDKQPLDLTPGLKQMLSYHMGWEDGGRPGKRIRPLLTLLCNQAFGGAISYAFPAAVSLEYLHNFTLIHDDIEDRSPQRHGQDTVWYRWGVPQAINAGDAMFSIAQLAMLGLADICPIDVALQAAHRLNEICLHLTQGQYLDISFETEGSIPLETYLTMIEGKTAALVAFAAELGGITAGKDTSIICILSEFGRNLGIAFQIQDDFLGIWGDPNITGKSTASDISTKKKTLPILYGLQNSVEFASLWKVESPTSEQVQQMADLLETCGAKEFVKHHAESHTDQAFTALETLFPNHGEGNNHAQALFELCEVLLARKM